MILITIQFCPKGQKLRQMSKIKIQIKKQKSRQKLQIKLLLPAVYWTTYSGGPCLSKLLLHNIPLQVLAASHSKAVFFVIILGVGLAGLSWAVLPHVVLSTGSHIATFNQKLTKWPVSGGAYTHQKIDLGLQESKSRNFRPFQAYAQNRTGSVDSAAFIPLVRASRRPDPRGGEIQSASR